MSDPNTIRSFFLHLKDHFLEPAGAIAIIVGAWKGSASLFTAVTTNSLKRREISDNYAMKMIERLQADIVRIDSELADMRNRLAIANSDKEAYLESLRKLKVEYDELNALYNQLVANTKTKDTTIHTLEAKLIEYRTRIVTLTKILMDAGVTIPPWGEDIK